MLNSLAIDGIQRHSAQSFHELANKVFPGRMGKWLDVVLVIQQVGSLTTYQIVGARAVALFLRRLFGIDGKNVVLFTKIGVAALVLAPLSALRTTQALAKISPFSVVFIGITIVSVLVFFVSSFSRDGSICTFRDGTAMHNSYKWLTDNPLWLNCVYFTKYLSTLQQAFTIPGALPLIYNSVRIQDSV